MLKIQIEKNPHPKDKPTGALGFGTLFTDHMFLMDYTADKGWHNPRIVPYAPITLDPAALVFHYAQECFEGLKAYRTAQGHVQLFRPDKNGDRLAATHRRLCIPEIPTEDFVEAIRALVAVDADWVPAEPDTSLYLRPFTIATEPKLGVKASDSYLFCIIASPSGSYYDGGINPVRIYVEDEYTRAAPGGTGAIKCGGNYAASLLSGEKAHARGFDQVLWLDGVHRRYVEEVGSMNCFFKIDGVIYTAPTDGTVLPGITRMSCIELLKSWGYTVSVDRLAIDEVMAAAADSRLEEVFGTGTAAVISPVGELQYQNQTAIISGGKIGPVTQKLYDTLTGIQYGRIKAPEGWIVSVS